MRPPVLLVQGGASSPLVHRLIAHLADLIAAADRMVFVVRPTAIGKR
ncbi:hypothetical protein BJ973_003103 [Actinoplanes tereljensis]|nr:hypothetical protein [Actinoplanes tereljensis]